jgi:Raf kinase inhibitor-like YbhB/YbcL family protein
LACGASGLAAAEEGHGPPVLAKQLDPARGGTKLNVTSEALSSGAALNERFTQNGENHSLPLAWTRGPTGTVAYAILAEDASADRHEPIAHWLMYDIPGTTMRLPENLPKQAELDNGAMQGRNVANETGFLGPKPPAGQTHNYHFQVFALNSRLRLDPAETDRDDLVKAMKGHVPASGDFVATYTGK